MPVKLRLRRQGRKGLPYYHIVAADARSPRDGKFLEKIGSYDPTKVPAAITLDDEAALKWLGHGAQPTDTVKAIFRYRGVNLRFALMKQGKTEEQIAEIYGRWAADKEARIQAHKDDLSRAEQKRAEENLERERKIREAKAAAIAAKNKPEEPEPAPEEAAEAGGEGEGENAGAEA